MSGAAFRKPSKGKGVAKVGEAILLTGRADGAVGISIRKNAENLTSRVNSASGELVAAGSTTAPTGRSSDIDVTPASIHM